MLIYKSKKRNELAVSYKKLFAEEWDIHLEIGSAFVCKQIRSGCDSKALPPGHDHAILSTGAVDDEEIAYAVIAADDPDVAVVRVKDKIAGQCVCPCNVGAIAML